MEFKEILSLLDRFSKFQPETNTEFTMIKLKLITRLKDSLNSIKIN